MYEYFGYLDCKFNYVIYIKLVQWLIYNFNIYYYTQ